VPPSGELRHQRNRHWPQRQSGKPLFLSRIRNGLLLPNFLIGVAMMFVFANPFGG
jgi:hypothetical protein